MMPMVAIRILGYDDMSKGHTNKTDIKKTEKKETDLIESYPPEVPSGNAAELPQREKQDLQTWSTTLNRRKLLIGSIPYAITFYLGDKLHWLFRYCAGRDLIASAARRREEACGSQREAGSG